jgi:hypothetical protein
MLVEGISKVTLRSLYEEITCFPLEPFSFFEDVIVRSGLKTCEMALELEERFG